MLEPQIVYCENNHIYDKSISEECPYCKKIKVGQLQLRTKVGKWSKGIMGAESEDNNATELEDLDATELEDDDATELEDDDATELEDDDATELEDDTDASVVTSDHEFPVSDEVKVTEVVIPGLAGDKKTVISDGVEAKPIARKKIQLQFCSNHHMYDSSMYANCPYCSTIVENKEVQINVEDTTEGSYGCKKKKNKVVGWLVIVGEGMKDYGKSISLYESINKLNIETDGTVHIIGVDDEVKNGFAISNEYDKFYLTAYKNGRLFVNDEAYVGDDSKCLQPYSEIEFGDNKFIFWPLLGINGFSWEKK